MEHLYYHFSEEEVGCDLHVLLSVSIGFVDITAIDVQGDNDYYMWSDFELSVPDLSTRSVARRFINDSANSGCSEGSYNSFRQIHNAAKEYGNPNYDILINHILQQPI